MDDNGKITKSGCTVLICVIVLAGLILLLLTCTVKVPADQVGVRTQLTSTGVEKKDYGAGYVLAIPGFHLVRLWDPTWTNLTQTLSVRTSDQYTTQVDISVVFRIMPGKCHEVALHFQDEDHIERRVKTVLNKYANEILAQMMTEGFYNTKVRNDKCAEAQKAMAQTLEQEGIELRYLLLRNIVYDPKFEQQLLQKQLAGQRKSLEMSKGLLAGAQTETELIKKNAENTVKQIDENKKQEIENLNADTERKISNTIQDAKLLAASIMAKAESSKRQKLAQADLLKASAAATGTAALSRVYSRPGAAFYFARKAIEGVKLGEIEVNSSLFNPLDCNRLLEAVGLDLKPHNAAKSAPNTSGKP
jgi:hypothetical protein